MWFFGYPISGSSCNVVFLGRPVFLDITGAYYQLSYTRQMKRRTEYVARENAREVRREVANYKRFKALSEEWVDLCIEHSRLRIKLARRSSPTVVVCLIHGQTSTKALL
jgi:hypothetical protein